MHVDPVPALRVDRRRRHSMRRRIWLTACETGLVSRPLPRRAITILVSLILVLGSVSATARVDLWLTDPAGVARFEPQPALAAGDRGTNQSLSITVEEQQVFQTMDGFGFCLTGGSATHLIRMSVPERKALLQELFGTEGRALGTSYLRVSIGASDLNAKVFSYDDLPPGQTDPELKHFDLGPDRMDVIPVLQEILTIQPSLKILGSPWSPPVWMKDNQDTRGGKLKPECYAVYAQYFVKYIKAMKQSGIRIDAITPQNEPLHPGNNPSLLMFAPEQLEFVKNHLGPAFRAAKLDTKIILYDHNADRPDYPISILNDSEARKYVDGSAFHMYRGKIEALSEVHRAHPDKHLYFTEQWVGGPGNLKDDLNWHVKTLIIGATRNWCRNVLEWNLAADSKYQPHTDRGGCDRCLGAVTIDGNQVTRNPAYYVIAHAAKFVRPGSLRIASTELERLPNVAFRTPTGKKVLIVLNVDSKPLWFSVHDGGNAFESALNGGAVGSYVW